MKPGDDVLCICIECSKMTMKSNLLKNCCPHCGTDLTEAMALAEQQGKPNINTAPERKRQPAIA